MTTPVTTTFYTHRVFLSYLPGDYRGYLMKVVDTEGWRRKSEADRFQLELGLFAWGTILVYRARMVPFHFNRELKRLVDENGKFFEPDPATPLRRGICRQQLAMQLGIEAIMRREAVRERIFEVPVFQQYIYDTLYWPSYQHEQGMNAGENGKNESDPFLLTMESLKKYLWFRAKGTRQGRNENFPPDDVAAVLLNALHDYLQLLAAPSSIRDETMRFARQLADEKQQRLWIALARAIETRPLVSIARVETAS
jgi:hypothetical protein